MHLLLSAYHKHNRNAIDFILNTWYLFVFNSFFVDLGNWIVCLHYLIYIYKVVAVVFKLYILLFILCSWDCSIPELNIIALNYFYGIKQTGY